MAHACHSLTPSRPGCSPLFTDPRRGQGAEPHLASLAGQGQEDPVGNGCGGGPREAGQGRDQQERPHTDWQGPGKGQDRCCPRKEEVSPSRPRGSSDPCSRRVALTALRILCLFARQGGRQGKEGRRPVGRPQQIRRHHLPAWRRHLPLSGKSPDSNLSIH